MEDIEFPNLPRFESPEANAMVDSVMAEHSYPRNPRNAARVGFEAACRLFADREKRAQAAQPVAWAAFAKNGNIQLWSTKPPSTPAFSETYAKLRPLYDHPPTEASKPVQAEAPTASNAEREAFEAAAREEWDGKSIPDAAWIGWQLRAALDAERYRWLRHGDNDERVLCHYRTTKLLGASMYLPRNEQLDTAIDAARTSGEANHG